MNKEFIPYEQALALKQLGFNESVFGTYGYNGENTTTYFPLETICRMEEYELSNFGIRNSNIGDDVSAPTFSQAMRFFREKYNLPNHIHTMWQHDWSNYSYQWHITKDKEEWNCIEHYKTYEQAELACLNNLIEIVNQSRLPDLT